MTLIDDYCEPERILSYIEANSIYNTEYNMLKWLGQKERKEVTKEYIELKNNNKLSADTKYMDYIAKKLLKIRYYSGIYDKLPVLKREILLANAILPDDIGIIELLTKNGITIQHLKVMIRFRSIIKNKLTSTAPTITEELSEQIGIYKRFVSIIINLFESNYGFSDATIILNRICELLVTCPNLFYSISNNK